MPFINRMEELMPLFKYSYCKVCDWWLGDKCRDELYHFPIFRNGCLSRKHDCKYKK
ncbi:unnamed protein product, partial [marine sediment metagenome]